MVLNQLGGLSPTIKIQKMNQFVILSFGVGPLNWPSFIEIAEIACSTPAWCTHGLTLNSCITNDASTVIKYASIDDAVRFIRRTGRGCALAKTDVKNALRLIPINPCDYDLLVLCWDDSFCFDKCLQSRAWSFPCLGRFARRTMKKERLLLVYPLSSGLLSLSSLS